LGDSKVALLVEPEDGVASDKPPTVELEVEEPEVHEAEVLEPEAREREKQPCRHRL
jgi:hypothetical protein